MKNTETGVKHFGKGPTKILLVKDNAPRNKKQVGTK